MRLLLAALLAWLAASAACAKLTSDLPPDAPLRIGVLHRPEKCVEKTKSGDKLSMHYTGTLVDGSKFDSSLDRSSPFDFTLGKGQVIKGWDQGLLGMCVGEKRKLTIPSNMGYGDSGSPPKIPGKATLVFTVELLKITPAGGEETEEEMSADPYYGGGYGGGADPYGGGEEEL